jgi:hypothetical protein
LRKKNFLIASNNKSLSGLCPLVREVFSRSRRAVEGARKGSKKFLCFPFLLAQLYPFLKLNSFQNDRKFINLSFVDAQCCSPVIKPAKGAWCEPLLRCQRAEDGVDMILMKLQLLNAPAR